MKISLNWLNTYFKNKLDGFDLVKKFNLMSQEVSSFEKLLDINGLVIGHVKSMEKHENADKLNVCQVDVGNEILQIICGAPNVDVNQKVIVAKVGAVLPGDFKIKKAKIRGVESFGMICSLQELGIQEFDSDEKGIYVLESDASCGENPLQYLGLDDFVLELDLTANRSDLLSYRGVAYDVACMLDLDIEFRKVKVDREPKENPVSIYTQTKDSSVYYGQVLEGVKVKDSPYWLKSRLIASGIRPINNVVDITNYVMLEYGQPLHAFDYEKIKSDRIIVREAITGEKITTLDGEERTLLDGDIVITDGEKPIALAGVMGGLDTEIDNSSTTILLESAIFNPVKVRKTANRLNLKSESSSRFEKGIDYQETLNALNYACSLLVELADAKVIGNPSFYNNINSKKKTIKLSLDKINSITGYAFTDEVVEDIFRRLRFSYKYRNDQYIITVSSRRPMDSYQDIIEEIVRINGYDKIPVSLPITPTQGGLNHKQSVIRQIRNYFVGKGLSETKTYSLVSLELATLFDQEESETIRILNPLTKEREYLRHSILPSLMGVLSYNKARKIDDVLLFEIANTYFKNGEKLKLAALISGKINNSTWQKMNCEIDFYYIKGLLETLFKELGITEYSFELSKETLPQLHPGISALVKVNDQVCGFLGKIHPETEIKIGLKDIFVMEIDLSNILNRNQTNVLGYKEISKYPSVNRDLAIWLDKNISAKEVVSVIKEVGNKTLNSVEIFDVYYDDEKSNLKSIALSLEFSSSDRTLETKEVDNQINKIIDALNNKLNAILRS
ncbi:MAG: phenylalanine--tRNA ligase subunit beta [Candidatus Izemoplasmatales bacterium]